MPTTELLEKPAKVVLAAKMLYLVVGIGIIRSAITVIRHADVRSPDFLILTKVLIYTASLFLIYQVGKGKNWARWSLVGILAVSIPLTVLPAFASISHNPIFTILGFLQLGLYVVALVLLFHGRAASWFDSGKVSQTRS